MASTYLTRTEANFGTATNRKKCTISFWLKKSLLTSQQAVMGVETTPAGGSNEARIVLKSDDTFEFYDYQSGYTFRYKTNRLLRDTSAYYHIVLTVDTTQSTTSDRVKIYINGVQETSFSIGTHPNQNLDTFLNSGAYVQIGRQSTGNSYFDGLISHFHFIDGTAYDASAFGETDATTGEWKAKTSPSVTYGTNGFLILKDGNTITDQSSNSNDFTLGGGTLTNLKDNPDNVFATLNPLGLNADVTFANGNNNATYGTSGTRSIVTGTLGANSGKYYWECEIQGNADANNAVLGVSMSGWETGYAVAGETNQSWGFRGFDGAVHNNNSSVGGTWATFTNGDIIGVAINLDDEQGGLNKLYFSKNGTWLNGADPSTPSSTTGVIGITKPENGDSGFYFPVVSDAGSTATPKFKMNFGNGYFGTVAVSSAGTNASENGIFEYDVPTGYSALSTKGLNL